MRERERERDETKSYMHKKIHRALDGAAHNEPTQDNTEVTGRGMELEGEGKGEQQVERRVEMMSSEQSNIERAVQEVTVAASQSECMCTSDLSLLTIKYMYTHVLD